MKSTDRTVRTEIVSLLSSLAADKKFRENSRKFAPARGIAVLASALVQVANSGSEPGDDAHVDAYHVDVGVKSALKSLSQDSKWKIQLKKAGWDGEGG